MHVASRFALRLSVIASICALVDISVASAQTLRVVAYNIDADTASSPNFNQPQFGGPLSGPGLTTVLQAIGNAKLAGHAQPIDVLGLEELWAAPFITLNYITSQLNNIYPTANYVADLTADPTTGGTGGGPNGIIYNANTVQLLGANAIGNATGGGAPRAPMRYTLAPVGITDHSGDFTMYVSHMKANSGSGDNIGRRNFEAQELRADAATLGANAHVIFSGDLNVLNSSESTYQTLISSSLNGGVGQAVDPVNPANNWSQSSTFKGLFTESATSDSARFDFQLITAPMVNQTGMQLVPGTYTAFGNGGNIYHQSVTSASNSAALADLGMAPYTPAYRSSVLTALTTATDHLPLVADYTYVAPPAMLAGDYNNDGVIDGADYTVWRDSFGQVVTAGSGADGDGSGTIDQADYDTWVLHFGETQPGSGAGAVSTATVPEPSAAALLVIGGCLMGLSVGRLKGWTRRN